MPRDILVEAEQFPIAGSFTISRGSKTVAEVITVSISSDGKVGRGEGVPYPRYGETVASATAEIEAARPQIAAGIGRMALLSAMPAGAARNAVDCALWDLEAKLTGQRVHQKVCRAVPKPLTTAFTLSLAAGGDGRAGQGQCLAAAPQGQSRRRRGSRADRRGPRGRPGGRGSSSTPTRAGGRTTSRPTWQPPRRSA